MRWGPVLLAGAGLFPASCAPGPVHAAAPSVEFVRVPPAEEGGSARMASVEGRVRGAGPGQRVVLYARSGSWFVQPFADRPFTIIRPDSTWRSSTHLGTEYAALLVDAAYLPAATASVLPGTGNGVAAVAVVDGEPEFWRKRWFAVSAVLAAALVGWALHRRRLRELTRQLHLRSDERLAERTRIAQELYDTLLQGFLSASMQLHLAVDRLPESSPERPCLDRLLCMMGQVTDEGRNVLQGLRSSDGEGQRLDKSLARIPHELGLAEATEYRVVASGVQRRLHPIIRDEVYSVGREVVVHALRHAQARAVEVEVAYSPRALRLVVRDDGCGIEASTGLAGMRERAGRIGAKLRVRSRAGAGTEVELSVPGAIAFQDAPAPPPPRERSE
jgi:signal transduction histidine kinase